MTLMSSHKPTTAFRPPSTSDVNRPMTAVRGAGYTSHGKVFDPLNQAALAATPPLELQKEETCVHITYSHYTLYTVIPILVTIFFRCLSSKNIANSFY